MFGKIKKTGVSQILLQRFKGDGGIGLPNIRHYYWAANIRCLAFWNHFYVQPSSPEWTSMELKSCRDISLPVLLTSPLNSLFIEPVDNPAVLCEGVGSVQEDHLSLLTPVASNHFFTPSRLYSAFQDWHRKGIRWLNDLFKDNCFISFDQLSEKYDLSKIFFFQIPTGQALCAFYLTVLPCRTWP